MSSDICFYTGPVLVFEKKMVKMLKKVTACNNDHCMEYKKETKDSICIFCKSDICLVDKSYYDYLDPTRTREYEEAGYIDFFYSCFDDKKFYYCHSLLSFPDKVISERGSGFEPFAFKIPQNIPEIMEEFYKMPDVKAFIEYFKSHFDLSFSFEYMTLKYNRYNDN